MAILSIQSPVCYGYAENRAAASVYGIMEAAFKAHSQELCIIAAQNELNSPSRSFDAVRLSWPQ